MYGYAITPYKNEPIESLGLGYIFKLISRFDMQTRTINRFHSSRCMLAPILNLQGFRCSIDAGIAISQVAMRCRVLLRRLALFVISNVCPWRYDQSLKQ